MSENNVTLNDLSNGAKPVAAPVGMPARPRLNTKNVKEANLTEAVLPGKDQQPTNGTGNPMLDAAFLGLDSTIDRLASESQALINKGNEERIERAIDSNDGDIDNEDEVNTIQPTTIKVNKFDDIETASTVTNTPIPATEEVKTVSISKPVMVEKVVENSAPVAGTKKENISIVADDSIYDDDDHLFDGIDDEDMKFLDDEEETDNEETEASKDEKAKTEAIKNTIRNEMINKFKPIHNKLDLSGFSISKKPINASKVINEIKSKAIECADGVLLSEKRAIRMSAWKPMEIQSIDPQRVRGGSSNYNKYIENKLKLIYEHIIDANKPKSFEAWAMITPNTVMDDYMFTSYKATFGTANIVTFTCPDDKCNNVFMENVPVHSMLKFRDDTIKEEYMNILKLGNTDSTTSEYKVDLYQASDEYVIGLKVPSLYNTYIEPTLVDNAFSTKYEDLILLLSYIDSIYILDRENRQLIPIDTKPVANDKVLSYKRRIKTYATILKSLTSDQLQALSVETDKYDAGKLDDDGELIRDITYVYPERRCPKCGKKIDEVEVNPDSILFTRHQLGLMKKI
jgi:hypothetical protein